MSAECQEKLQTDKISASPHSQNEDFPMQEHFNSAVYLIKDPQNKCTQTCFLNKLIHSTPLCTNDSTFSGMKHNFCDQTPKKFCKCLSTLNT